MAGKGREGLQAGPLRPGRSQRRRPGRGEGRGRIPGRRDRGGNGARTASADLCGPHRRQRSPGPAAQGRRRGPAGGGLAAGGRTRPGAGRAGQPAGGRQRRGGGPALCERRGPARRAGQGCARHPFHRHPRHGGHAVHRECVSHRHLRPGPASDGERHDGGAHRGHGRVGPAGAAEHGRQRHHRRAGGEHRHHHGDPLHLQRRRLRGGPAGRQRGRRARPEAADHPAPGQPSDRLLQR